MVPNDELPVFCINLLRAEKRRELMHLRWNVERDFNVQFHVACDRRDIGLSSWFSETLHREISAGEIACILSHLELLLYCEGRFSEIVVLEDDVLPLVDSKAILVERIRQARTEFPQMQFLHLGYSYKRSKISDKIYAQRKLTASAGNKAPTGAFAYYLTCEGIQALRYQLQTLQFPADIPQDVYFASRGLFAVLNQPIAAHPWQGNECYTYIGNDFRRSFPRKFVQ